MPGVAVISVRGLSKGEELSSANTPMVRRPVASNITAFESSLLLHAASNNSSDLLPVFNNLLDDKQFSVRLQVSVRRLFVENAALIEHCMVKK